MTINLKLNGDWEVISHMLKQQYPVLSESDLKFDRDQESSLASRLAVKLKVPEEEIYSVLLKMKLKARLGESVLSEKV